MEVITEKTIDIEKVLHDKMGSRSRWVPGFAVNWLKKIAHEDDNNKFLWDARDLKGTEWLNACMKFLDTRLEVEGLENLPSKDDGRFYTFVSNHPMGGIDGVALGSLIGQHYGDNFRYLVNDLLMTLPGLAPLCIPINKTGSQSRSFPAMVEAGFKGDYHILMFPAGLCSRRHNGEIREGIYRWDNRIGRYILDCENPGWETVETRSRLILETEEFGLVALMPIGMSQICSVNFSEGLAPGVRVRKGQELGYFLFGGSDFVILFQKGVHLSLAPQRQSDGTLGHILTGERLGTLSVIG